MADSPLNQALTQLNGTITGITDKINEQKDKVIGYKRTILEQLTQVVNKIQELNNNDTLKGLPQLRQQLQQVPRLQQELNDKNSELEKAKQDLANANDTIQGLQTDLETINQQIAQKNNEIQQLTNSNSDKDQQIVQLTQQVDKLNEEKTEIQNNLVSATQQINGFVQQINDINIFLNRQISNIGIIANELSNIDSGDIGNQIQGIIGNIQGIIDMINNPGPSESNNQGPSESNNQGPIGPTAASFARTYDTQQNIIHLRGLRNDPNKQQYLQFTRTLDGDIKRDIDNNIRSFDANDENAIRVISEILEKNKIKVPSFIGSGGKRRRRTMKKRHHKTRKHNKKQQKGGYVYSTSKDLDKASSVISSSSGSTSSSTSKSKSKSKSKSRHKDKTRRNSMK